MLKRSPIKKKSSLKKSSTLKNSSPLRQKTRIKAKGKKTKEWEEARKLLTKAFEKCNITSCELKREGCTGSYFTTWAHSKKRRYINSYSELLEVGLLCISCHTYAESLPKEEMYILITDIIKNRSEDVTKYL